MALVIRLRGAGGEPVDLWRTLNSHGVTELPPMALDHDRRAMEVTLPVPGGRPRTMSIAATGPRTASVSIHGRAPGAGVTRHLVGAARRLLALDQDLSGFYGMAGEDPDLAWVTGGAGRMARSSTVFEDVIKTVCTTNCSWALTTKMVTTLVERLGQPAAGAPRRSWRGRAFPTPRAMAVRPERFYRDVVRAGYRAPHLRAIAGMVADGLDLEILRAGTPLADQEVEERLVALPGVGPYAAAHVMHLIGRHSRLILDSWSRPAYGRLAGYRRVPKDTTILRRFRRYGPWAGLAFWCFVTRDWVPGAEDPGPG